MKMVNKRLGQFCRQHQWKLVHHNNILTSEINRNGLHLNRRGNKLLDKNFVNSLLHWQAIPSAHVSNEIPAAGINTNSSSESFHFLPSMRGFKLASSHNATLPKHIDSWESCLLTVLWMFCRLMNRLAITRFIFPVTRSFAVIENMIVGLVRAFISMFALL